MACMCPLLYGLVSLSVFSESVLSRSFPSCAPGKPTRVLFSSYCNKSAVVALSTTEIDAQIFGGTYKRFYEAFIASKCIRTDRDGIKQL
ncbi:unnamed protein product [Dracunculus medinensis]|uniref:Secreted protein n=1 Tax=Dracunculus medinensis TaxID=318479 RepID=A0A0N4U959_DRAME|nr:unnamed protein product [Dracunculus medinensis]